MDAEFQSPMSEGLVLSQPSQSSQGLSSSSSQSSAVMPPPPPRSCSLSLLQTPKTVRMMEGPMVTVTSSAPKMAPRSSSIPTMLQTPGSAYRTPHNRGDATPGTPGRTPGKATIALKSTAEICAKVAELGVQLTPDQLKTPTHELLYPVFQAVVRVFVEPSYAFCDDNEIFFLRDLMGIVESCGFTGFTLQDILKPDPKRTRQILSAILLFKDFWEARMKSYEQAMNSIVQHRDLKISTSLEVERLKAEIAQREEFIQANLPEAQRVSQEVEALVQQLRSKAEEKAHQEARKAELQARLNGVKDHNAHLRYRAQELSQEIPHMSQKLVHSPARVKQEALLAHEQVERGKVELLELDHRCIGARIWLDKASKADKALDGLLEQLRATGALKQQWKTLKEELRRLEMAKARGALDQNMEEDIERLRARQKELSSLWNRLQDPDCPELDDPIPVPREEQEVLLQDLQAQIDGRLKQVQEAEDSHRAGIRKVMDHLHLMEQQVRDYSTTVSQRLRSS